MTPDPDAVARERELMLGALDDNRTAEVEAALDRVMIRKRTLHLDRAVSLGIIDHGQRCALLQLFVEELAAMRARERANDINPHLRRLGERITEP